MEYEYRITDENGGDPTPIIEAMLKEHPLLKPYCVFVDDDKAEFIEFGTEKARDSAKKYFGQESPIKGDLEDWIKTKYGISDPAKVRGIASSIYNKIMKEGIPPYPYLRPAMYKVVDAAESNTSDPYLDQPHPNGCFFDMCTDIADIMKETLRMNDNIYSGDLLQSIDVVEPDEIPTDADPETGSKTKMEEQVWDDKEMGVKGKRPSKGYWRP